MSVLVERHLHESPLLITRITKRKICLLQLLLEVLAWTYLILLLLAAVVFDTKHYVEFLNILLIVSFKRKEKSFFINDTLN